MFRRLFLAFMLVTCRFVVNACGTPERCPVVTTEILEENKEVKVYSGEDITLNALINIDCHALNSDRSSYKKPVLSCNYGEAAQLNDFEISQKDYFGVEYVGNEKNDLKFKLTPTVQMEMTFHIDLVLTFELTCSWISAKKCHSYEVCPTHHCKHIKALTAERSVTLKTTFTVEIQPNPVTPPQNTGDKESEKPPKDSSSDKDNQEDNGSGGTGKDSDNEDNTNSDGGKSSDIDGDKESKDVDSDDPKTTDPSKTETETPKLSDQIDPDKGIPKFTQKYSSHESVGLLGVAFSLLAINVLYFFVMKAKNLCKKRTEKSFDEFQDDVQVQSKTSNAQEKSVLEEGNEENRSGLSLSIG